MSWWFLLFPTALLKCCVSQGILSPQNKPQSYLCSYREHRALPVWFSSLWLVGASLRWLVLELASYHCRRPTLLWQCWLVENPHKKIFFSAYKSGKWSYLRSTWCPWDTNYKVHCITEQPHSNHIASEFVFQSRELDVHITHAHYSWHRRHLANCSTKG